MSPDTIACPPPDGCERVASWEELQATADRIRARLAAAEAVAQSCVQWLIETGDCPLCAATHPLPHSSGCPIPAYLATVRKMKDGEPEPRPHPVEGIYEEPAVCALCGGTGQIVGASPIDPCPACAAADKEKR